MRNVLLRAALAASLLTAAAAPPAAAQDLFSPLIVVNDGVVTGYELDQRIRMLTFFDTPGDVAAEARRQLVEDRLKQQEFYRVGIELTADGLGDAIDDFAARADLDADQFIQLLEQNGIAAETLRDYVGTNVTWRDYVRTRFDDRVTVTEAEIDQRLAQDATQSVGVEVLLSEIIIPAPPERAVEAGEAALAASRLTTEAEFAQAARELSATPTAESGGRLDWMPLATYPPALQDVLLSLAPGQVTPPIPLDGAVALLQLRAIREGPAVAAAPAEIDYAVLRIPGGLTDPALAEARRIAAEVDACDDLYGVAQGRPEGSLLRQSVAPEAVPADLAVELAKLDVDEATYGLTADGGRTLLFVMLCARTAPLPEGAPDRAAVEAAIRSDRLGGYADALLADLRAAATIVGE